MPRRENTTEQPRGKRQRQKQVEITGYVEKTLKERVRVLGEREGLSESEIVRTAVREFFFRRSGRLEVQPSPREASAPVPAVDEVRAPPMAATAERPAAASAPRSPRRRRRRACGCCCQRCPRRRR